MYSDPQNKFCKSFYLWLSTGQLVSSYMKLQMSMGLTDNVVVGFIPT